MVCCLRILDGINDDLCIRVNVIIEIFLICVWVLFVGYDGIIGFCKYGIVGL